MFISQYLFFVFTLNRQGLWDEWCLNEERRKSVLAGCLTLFANWKVKNMSNQNRTCSMRSHRLHTRRWGLPHWLHRPPGSCRCARWLRTWTWASSWPPAPSTPTACGCTQTSCWGLYCGGKRCNRYTKPPFPPRHETRITKDINTSEFEFLLQTYIVLL